MYSLLFNKRHLFFEVFFCHINVLSTDTTAPHQLKPPEKTGQEMIFLRFYG